MVIVDTTVWSLALRRRPESLNVTEQQYVEKWAELTNRGEVLLLGIVRQEILSGVRSQRMVERLRRELDVYTNMLAEQLDHDRAADCFNACRAKGISPGDVDMLICSMALRGDLPILSTDHDFVRYANILPIRLLLP